MSAITASGSSVTATPAQTIEELAVLVTAQLLQPRRTFLKGRAPRDERVHQLRRDMAGDAPRKEAVKRILVVLFADLDDGVPTEMACGFAYTIIALAGERAQQRSQARGEPAVAPDTFALIQSENRAQVEQDAAEREVCAHPTSPVALQRLLDANAKYEITNDRMVRGIRWSYARAVARSGMASV